jgi:hypothetical protein
MVNGLRQTGTTPDEVVLLFDALPREARIEIVTEGGWPAVAADVAYPRVPSMDVTRRATFSGAESLAASLRKPYTVLSRFRKLLEKEPETEYERAFVSAALRAFESCAVRTSMDPGPGYFRTVTAERRATMQKFYENAALGMYEGLERRMSTGAGVQDARGWRIRKLFEQARR